MRCIESWHLKNKSGSFVIELTYLRVDTLSLGNEVGNYGREPELCCQMEASVPFPVPGMIVEILFKAPGYQEKTKRSLK